MATGYMPPQPGYQTAPRGRVRYIANRPRILSRKERIQRALKMFGAATLVVFAILMAYGVWTLHAIAQKLPPVTSLADTTNNPVTTIVTSDGVLLATFETKYRRPVTLSEISPNLIDATIAIEDARFYKHSGVDMRGVARALLSNMRSGNSTGQGGSTITQQLARNLYLSNEKTFRRKIEEMLLARQIEQRYNKHDILEAYLNTIYYGNGCYGVEAASRAYFHKSARDLSLAEASLLAGLPQRPLSYSPVQHLNAALARRSDVLRRMVVNGKISQVQREQAEKEAIRVFKPRMQSQSDWKAPYVVAHILSQMRDTYGPEFLYSGVKVVTTLNWEMQKAAERALYYSLHSHRGPNTGALISLDPRTGAVRVMVGGADFKADQFDAVYQGIRQPGSAFKPLVYTAAFDANVCNLANTLEDKKLIYQVPPKDWVVHNYDGTYRGTVTVLEALRQSINTIAVQVADQTGPTAVAAYAQRLGITTPMETNLPLALGASGVHPIDLCSAYTAFANGGNRYDPYLIADISDARGSEVFRDDPTKRLHANFLSGSTLEQINVALREVVLNGTGMAAAAIPDAHGKTGTTSSHRDAWFVGYTSNLTTAVWMAHVRKETVHQKDQVVDVTKYLPMPGATGGSLCAPTWARYMKTALSVQKRVDRAHNIAYTYISQPGTAALLAALQPQSSETSVGQAQAQLAQEWAAEHRQSAILPNYINAEDGSNGSEQARTLWDGQDSSSDSLQSSDREERRLEQSDDMLRDMDEGYREFERSKHKDNVRQ